MPLSSTAEPLPKIHVKLRTQPSRSLGHPSSPRLLSHPKTTIHQTQLDKPQYSIGTRLRTITASQQATSQGNAPKRQKVQPRAIQFSFELQKRKAGLEGGKQPGEIKARPGRQQDGEGTIQVRRRQNLQGDFGQIALAGTPQEDCNQLTDKVQNHQKQVRFAQLLRHKNPFFAKLGGVVALALLKIGTVVAFAAGDLLYQEARPIRHLGLILWGKLCLKKQKPKWKLQITSGQAIGEEIIFEQEDLRKRGKQITSRGQLLAFEDCRAITDCGVLLVGAKQIGWMDEQLSIEGLREQTLRFHSLLLRVYLKKRELRDHLR